MSNDQNYSTSSFLNHLSDMSKILCIYIIDLALPVCPRHPVV